MLKHEPQMGNQNARWSEALDVSPMFPKLLLMIDLKAQSQEAGSASAEERISISFNIMFSSFTKNLSKLLVSGGRAHARWRASGNGRTHGPVKPRIERWVA
jgi:hypothetical protein